MYNKPMLGMDQCQAGIAAMIAEFKKGTNYPPVGMAIVDDTGSLLAYALTDGCRSLLAKNRIKKAYTAAINGVNSEDYGEGLKSRGRNLADMGDDMLSATSGGVVIINPGDGAVLGGIGVAGLPAGPGDQNIALAGLKALNL